MMFPFSSFPPQLGLSAAAQPRRRKMKGSGRPGGLVLDWTRVLVGLGCYFWIGLGDCYYFSIVDRPDCGADWRD